MTIADAKAVSETHAYKVGIDVGGTSTKAVLLDEHMEVANTLSAPSGKGNEQVLDNIITMVHRLSGTNIDKVASVGIGIPGQVDSVTGRVDNVVNLGINTLELGHMAANRLQRTVHVENDVNAAAVGAARLLGAMDSGTIVFLNFGTGFAAGIVVDGVLHHGFSGASGEIGHIPVDPNMFACPCGQRGCLETVCSGASVERLWPHGEFPMPDLIHHAAEGSPQAVRVLGMITHAITDGIQIVAQTMDPRQIILGGGMAKTGQPLLDVVIDAVKAREKTCPFLVGLNLTERLCLSPSDQPVGAIGAALA